MNLKQVNECLAETEDQLMGGLAATDVFSKQSGMSIAGIRTAPKACALFNVVCERTIDSVKKSGLPIPQELSSLIITLGEDENVLIAVIDIDTKYRWGLAIDLTKTSMGVLISVVLPDMVPRLRSALGSRAS
ncbi:MAG: hypothetical protein H6710_12345 [Myxococcales bacterium]|nr:hypothetical protein [Myxococcales bacterium]MCB9700423.1 hypothetical protein [Myxococcales bacterium]